MTPRETTLKATKKDPHVSGIKQKVTKQLKQQHPKPAGKRRGKENRETKKKTRQAPKPCGEDPASQRAKHNPQSGAPRTPPSGRARSRITSRVQPPRCGKDPIAYSVLVEESPKAETVAGSACRVAHRHGLYLGPRPPATSLPTWETHRLTRRVTLLPVRGGVPATPNTAPACGAVFFSVSAQVSVQAARDIYARHVLLCYSGTNETKTTVPIFLWDAQDCLSRPPPAKFPLNAKVNISRHPQAGGHARSRGASTGPATRSRVESAGAHIVS